MAQAWTRARGAVIAAAVSGLTAAAAYWCGADDVMKIAGWGTPIGAMVALSIAPRALRPGRAVSSAVFAAVVAIGIAITVLAGAGLIDAVQGHSEALLLFLPLVIGYAFVYGLPVAVPVALVTVALLRWTVRRPRLGTALVATLAGAAVALGAAGIALNGTLAARRGVDGRRAGEPPVMLLLGRTTVSWSVVNCSPWPYAITMTERSLLDGIRTTRSVAAGMGTTRGTRVVEPGWHLTLEVDDPAATIPFAYFGPKPIVEDVPGQSLELRIEVGSRVGYSTTIVVDGVTTAHAVPLCPG